MCRTPRASVCRCVCVCICTSDGAWHGTVYYCGLNAVACTVYYCGLNAIACTVYYRGLNAVACTVYYCGLTVSSAPNDARLWRCGKAG